MAMGRPYLSSQGGPYLLPPGSLAGLLPACVRVFLFGLALARCCVFVLGALALRCGVACTDRECARACVLAR